MVFVTGDKVIKNYYFKKRLEITIYTKALAF